MIGAGPDGSRVAIVTGAAQGIGRAIAQRLAADGALVVLVDVQAEGAKTAGLMQEAGSNAVFQRVDLRSPEQRAGLVPDVLRQFGRVDVLVNNAATYGPRSPITDLSDADWAEVIAVNLTATALLSRDVARDMLTRGSGSIINICTIQEKLPVPSFAAYIASKGGVSALTRAMAVELSPRGIRVNGILPGVIDTPSMSQTLDGRNAQGAAYSNGAVPNLLRRFGRADEVAAVVAFLASDQASYLTGALIDVDGGRALSRLSDPLSAPVLAE